MNFPNKSLDNKDAKLNLSNKVTTLNPNASEYVPAALRSKHENTRSADASRMDVPRTSGKAVLDRSESAISNNSDDEARQYWCRQLPDDITPDFTVMGEAELPGPGQFSLADLSIHSGFETPRFSAASLTLGTRQDRSPLSIDTLSSRGKLGYSGPTNSEYQSSAAFMPSVANSQVIQCRNGDQLTSGMEGHHYNVDPTAGFVNSLLGDQAIIEDAVINQMKFLASQFPGLAVGSLADVYYSNGCNLNLTIRMLTQLKLQGDGCFNQNLNSEALNAPNRSGLDFPALPVADAENGISKYTRDLQQAPNTYRSTSGIFRGTSDFASTVRKPASQDSGHWKYERNGSADASRSSQLLASPDNGHRKLVYGDESRSFGAHAAPVWLTGDAVANMYSESREETRDFAHLQDTCFDQASKASLIGNKAVAREMSEEGHFYNLRMKVAQGKASETVYRQRNLNLISSSELQGYSQGQVPTIDLHNLQVSDAMKALKHLLSLIRSTARPSEQRLQLRIFVGTSHHTTGSLYTASLPVIVEQYIREEGLQYTQPQPGLLLVIY